VYDVRLRDPSEKIYNRTFETKREAKTHQDAERADKRQGRWIDPRLSATLFEEMAAKWLDSSQRKRGSSWARDQSIISQHVNPAFAGRPVGSPSPSVIQGIVRRWSAAQAPSTVARQYAVPSRRPRFHKIRDRRRIGAALQATPVHRRKANLRWTRRRREQRRAAAEHQGRPNRHSERSTPRSARRPSQEN
jgi:hypothetical protein